MMSSWMILCFPQNFAAKDMIQALLWSVDWQVAVFTNVDKAETRGPVLCGLGAFKHEMILLEMHIDPCWKAALTYSSCVYEQWYSSDTCTQNKTNGFGMQALGVPRKFFWVPRRLRCGASPDGSCSWAHLRILEYTAGISQPVHSEISHNQT